MWEDDEGTCHGRFRIPALHGQMLTKMILAISSPVRSTSDDHIVGHRPRPAHPGPPRPRTDPADRDHPAEKLPKTGGCSATVVVTMTLEQLLADLDHAGVCTLDTGGRITAAEARRLACTAGIIPVVLGGKSQVLDVGRKRRLHTESMRLAMGVRDGGCTARAAKHHQASATPTTTRHGPKAAAPTSTTAASSAPTTTAASTTPSTRPDTYPAARSASTADVDRRCAARGGFSTMGCDSQATE